RQVRLLQTGAPDFEVGDPRTVPGEQLTHERRAVRGRMRSRLAVLPPADLGRACHVASELLGTAIGDDAAVIENEDAVGELSASPRSWVVSRIVVSSVSASRCTSSWNSCRATGSNPAVGSSRKSSSGRPTM